MNHPPLALVALVRSGEARRLRRAAGIRQATMAQALGGGQGNWSMYERGEWPPDLARAEAWLRVLNGLARHAEIPELGGDDP